uniref:Uncharacterized protein n=1 Tax=Rhizophora mucronata TaxID=61149 RepID=A0A2P2QGC0_RHIMU
MLMYCTRYSYVDYSDEEHRNLGHR